MREIALAPQAHGDLLQCSYCAIMQDYFQATNACPMKQKLGKEPRTGDHGKWVCGVKTLLQKPGCIVYSVGSNGLTGQLCLALLSLHAALTDMQYRKQSAVSGE